ncbi:hypothetical protein [Loktanella atrilutea]|uniref:hypothetical protein n=1 Tax=Loktanella atrilutea TaxID=366533 RepID=UPI000933F075|nr:hypothetical protein [Loktanella atrilutea]
MGDWQNVTINISAFTLMAFPATQIAEVQMKNMINCPMPGSMMAGCAAAMLLAGAILVLGVLALVKYLRQLG